MNIRSDLVDAHDRVWRSISQAGTWLTAEQRVAVLQASRSALICVLCGERKSALSPNAVQGVHEGVTSILSREAIDVVHKLVTDPGRITRAWVNGCLANGLTDAEYVEIAGLTSAIMVVDTFHAALGLPLRDVPVPRSGEPARNRPTTARKEDSYVPMIPQDGLQGDYSNLYDLSSRFVPNVHRAFSLVPEATRCADDLMASHYFPYEQVPAYTDADHDYAINKVQMELLASRVSIRNDCFY
ncbi:MAG: alkylhydroperoxidase-related (seleno)protein [Pseudomonadales bacterium]|nr:alkylhydroperoxidase-related (seleno)protein [Pseudomonadales bacterium]